MKCIVELFGDDRNGRKMIAWGRRIGCGDAGHVFDPDRRKALCGEPRLLRGRTRRDPSQGKRKKAII